jgi:hypothetical protein
MSQDGTALALGTAAVLTAGSILSNRLSGSSAIDSTLINYAGVSLELPTPVADRIEGALEAFGFHELEEAPGASRLRDLVRDLRLKAKREADRKRTKAARDLAASVKRDSAPLLELATALESVETTRLPGTAKAPAVEPGDTIHNTASRSFYHLPAGSTWVVEAIGGSPATVSLTGIDSIGRRTRATREVAHRVIRGLIDGNVLQVERGVK